MEVNVYGEVHVHTSEKSEKVYCKSSPELALLKRSIKVRDKKCQVCGEEDKPLEVHHIFPISKYPELGEDSSNLITLCQKCHRDYHNNYEGAEGAVSFSKYMRDNHDKTVFK